MAGDLRKKRLGPATKRQLAEDLVKEGKVKVRRACRLLDLSKSGYYYKSCRSDAEVIAALEELAFKHPSYGFRKLYFYLRRAGHNWNHKRVYRVCLLKLNKRRKGKRRLPVRVKQPLQQQGQVNKSWSMDFMSDTLVSGRKFRTLNVIDDCSREALAVEVDTSLSSRRVIQVLEQIIEERGRPDSVRVDNGPEFTSKDLDLWAREQRINLQYIQPGRPMQNGYIERFNGSYRKEILDAYLFFDLDEVRTLTEEWIEEYNLRRPHEALNNLTPNEWKQLTLIEQMSLP